MGNVNFRGIFTQPAQPPQPAPPPQPVAKPPQPVVEEQKSTPIVMVAVVAEGPFQKVSTEKFKDLLRKQVEGQIELVFEDKKANGEPVHPPKVNHKVAVHLCADKSRVEYERIYEFLGNAKKNYPDAVWNNVLMITSIQTADGLVREKQYNEELYSRVKLLVSGDFNSNGKYLDPTSFQNKKAANAIGNLLRKLAFS